MADKQRPVEDLVRAAMRELSGHGAEPISTGHLLLMLMRLDSRPSWQYVTLHTGGYERLEPLLVRRERDTAVERWWESRVTDELSSSLDRATRIAEAYQLPQIPVPVVVLAMVADPATEATRLLSLSGLDHSELVDLVGRELLDVELSGVVEFSQRRVTSANESEVRSAGQQIQRRDTSTADGTPSLSASIPPPPPPLGLPTSATSATSPQGPTPPPPMPTRVGAQWPTGTNRSQAFIPRPRIKAKYLACFLPLIVLAAVNGSKFLATIQEPPAPASEPIPLHQSELPSLKQLDGYVVDDLRTTPYDFTTWNLDEDSIFFDRYRQLVVEQYEIDLIHPSDGSFIQIRTLLTHSDTMAEAAVEPGYSRLSDGRLDAWVSDELLVPNPEMVLRGGDVVKGPVITKVFAFFPRDRSIEASEVVLSILEDSHSSVEYRETLPLPGLDNRDIRLRSLTGDSSLLLAAISIVTLVAVVRDRSLWVRLRRSPSRMFDRSSQLLHDLAALAYRRRWRSRLFSAPVAIAMVAAVVVAETANTARLIHTIAIGVALLALVELLRRLVARVSGVRSSPHERYPPVAIATGMVVAVGVVAVSWWVVTMSSFLSLTGIPNATTEEAQRVARSGAVFGLILLSAAPLPLRFLQARTRRPNTRDASRVLVLRSFTDDGLRLFTGRNFAEPVLRRLTQVRWRRFEEYLVENLYNAGTILTVGIPGHNYKDLGAHRFQVSQIGPPGDSDRGWLTEVVDLARASDRIVVVAGRSDGLLKELRALKQNGLLSRTLIVVPPISDRECHRRLAVISSMLAGVSCTADRPRGRSILTVRFDDDGQLQSITAGVARDWASYEVAVERELRLMVLADAVVAPNVRAVDTRPVDIPAPYDDWIASTNHKSRQTRLPWYTQGVMYVLAVSYVLGGCVAFVDTIPTPIEPAFAADLSRYAEPAPVQALPNGSTALVGLDEVWSVEYLANGELDAERFDAPGARRLAVDERATFVSGVEGDISRYPAIPGGPAEWQVETAGWVERLVSTGDLIVSTHPIADAVEIRSAASGDIVGRVSLRDAPWGIAVLDEHLYVSLANSDEVLQISLNTLSVEGSYEVLEGPRDIQIVGDRMAVTSVIEDGVTFIDPFDTAGVNPVRLDVELHQPIGLIGEYLLVAQGGLGGNILAIGGDDRVAGELRVGGRNIAALAPVGEGLLVVLDDGRVKVVDSLDLDEALTRITQPDS